MEPEALEVSVDVPITHSARRYGYVFWPEEVDSQMQRWFLRAERIPVVFQGEPIGDKSIDWSRRRIYVGIPKTLAIAPDRSTFRISHDDSKGLVVRCV
jgi:hypothetical protein